MSLYQVSFRASYSTPGELSTTTMKNKQKCDFRALGDTYPEMENTKNKTTTVTASAHHSSPLAPPPPYLRIGMTGSMASASPAAKWKIRKK